MRKNVSRVVPNGTTLQTRDEFIFTPDNSGVHSSYHKPGYANKGFYRRVVVVDSNYKDELAVVKLSTKGTPLVSYKNGRSCYRPFVHTLDDKAKPIKIGYRFKRNSVNHSVSKRDVAAIKRACFTGNHSIWNRASVRKLKNKK